MFYHNRNVIFPYQKDKKRKMLEMKSIHSLIHTSFFKKHQFNSHHCRFLSFAAQSGKECLLRARRHPTQWGYKVGSGVVLWHPSGL